MASVPCDSNSTQNSTVALSRVINFPPAANVTGVRPLVFIQATARINYRTSDQALPYCAS